MKLNILPRSIRAKIIFGVAFLIDSQLEVYLGFRFLPKYYIQIVGPINIAWILSTFFATILGAVSLWLGMWAAWRKLRQVLDGKMTFKEALRGKPVEKT